MRVLESIETQSCLCLWPPCVGFAILVRTKCWETTFAVRTFLVVRVCVCFISVCFLRLPHSACQDSVLVEALLSLTIAGSRQHVAVIKSKEIGEWERGAGATPVWWLCQNEKKKSLGGWKENGRLIKRAWKRLVKSRHLWRNVFVLRPENLHSITRTQTHSSHTHTHTVHTTSYTHTLVTVFTCADRRAQTASLFTCTDGESMQTYTHTHTRRGGTLHKHTFKIDLDERQLFL